VPGHVELHALVEIGQQAEQKKSTGTASIRRAVATGARTRLASDAHRKVSFGLSSVLPVSRCLLSGMRGGDAP
jgi:hypothetical protein